MDITLDDNGRGDSLGGAATHLVGEIERSDYRTWITLVKNRDQGPGTGSDIQDPPGL